MKKRYLSLPKEYLSYSQMALWMSHPSQYKDLYFDHRDELRRSNAGMEYGKAVADALEKGVETNDLLTDAAILILPKYDVADQEFRVDIKTTQGWLTLLAKPDSFNSVTKDFLEYKTGKHPWTQVKANESLQLQLYAACIYLKHKVIPSAKLIWMETVWEDGIVVPTGHIEEFPVEFKMADILRTLALVTMVAKQIEVAYSAHVPNKDITEY